MSTVIDDFRKVRFAASLVHRAQQETSILSGTVDREELSGHKIFLDDYGSITMQETVGRAPDTPTGTVPRNRRMMFRKEYIFSELLHRNDRLDFDGMVEPNSKYRQTFSMAVARQIDQAVIDAFDATVSTGEAGAGSAAFTDSGEGLNSTSVDIAAASALTNAHVQTAAQLLDDQNAPPEDRFMLLTPKQWRTLLTESSAPIATFDMNDEKPLITHGGLSMTWGGFTLLKSTLLPTSATTATKKYLFFWQKQGVVLGIANQGRWEVDSRSDKSHATQTAMYLDVGATRRLPGHVGRIGITS